MLLLYTIYSSSMHSLILPGSHQSIHLLRHIVIHLPYTYLLITHMHSKHHPCINQLLITLAKKPKRSYFMNEGLFQLIVLELYSPRLGNAISLASDESGPWHNVCRGRTQRDRQESHSSSIPVCVPLLTLS